MKTTIQATKDIISRHLLTNGWHGNVDKMIFEGGKDPGGWSSKVVAVCVIHENSDLPNEYNHPDPFQWWDVLAAEIEKECNVKLYFEPVNSCVMHGYLVPV